MKAYFYILECEGHKLYCGSTTNLDYRYLQHCAGVGANFTRKYPPIRIAYFEEYQRIDEAFYREKQVQNWSRSKKEALIRGELQALKSLAKKDFGK